MSKLQEAADRVRKYLQQRGMSRGYDGDIHGFHSGDPREAKLTTFDLEILLAAVTKVDTQSIQAKVDDMLAGMWNGENYDVTPGEIVALIEQEVVAAKTAPTVALTRLAIRVGGSGANVYAFTEADDDGDYVFYTEAVAASKHGDPK